MLDLSWIERWLQQQDDELMDANGDLWESREYGVDIGDISEADARLEQREGEYFG